MFGLFEGLYNHVVKDVLYFGGATTGLMMRLFPPPTYEMPNDMFFELTGILQVVPAAFAAWYLHRMMNRRGKSPRMLFTGFPVEPNVH
jgi:hypothetical protein